MTYSPIQKTLAWSVHLFTASGLVAGFMGLLAVSQGEWRMAMIWLIVTQIIDGIDGTFARIFKVKEVLPEIDGQTIDYVIDFFTYAILPAYFIYMAVPMDDWRMPAVSIILLVSAVYYGKTGMVTNDMYFLGFPVMWNMVAFFLVFVFSLPALANVAIIVFFAILHFVPIKFVYPSQGRHFRIPTIIVTCLFLLSMLWLTWVFPERPDAALGICIAGSIYYGVMAIYNTWVE